MLKKEAKIIKTKNIQKSMIKYASENSLNLQECDFSIKQIETYIKENSTAEFILVSKDLLEEYTDKERISNEHIEFNQVYTIAVKKLKNSTLKLNYEIALGDNATHPKITIKRDSKIPYKNYTPKDMLRLLYQEINKIKVFNSILINIFDEDMKRNLKAFIKHLYAGKFTKNIRLPLFSGIEAVITRESKLVYWFKEKNQQNQIIEVDADEVLIEYKKPIFGKNGFDAYGQEVDSGFGENSDDLQATIDKESIYIKEDEKSKFYKSKRKGYIHFDGNTLSVDNRVRMSKISRNNITLASEEENNIEVMVSQNDTNKDSIGEGVELVSETININGHVGAKSTVEAINLKIDGATHQDSKQFAKYASINRHKGTLRCHEAKVKLLEGGEIHATKVDIETCLGGSIYAQDVTIGHVKSNLKVYASNSITIHLVSGEDNYFKINYRDVPILNSKINFINEEIEDLKFQLEDVQKHTLSKIPAIKKEIEKLKNQQKAIQNSYLNAKISIEKTLYGLNNIIFVVDDENEIRFKTEPQAYTAFYLELTEDKITLLPTNKSISLNQK